MVSISKKGEIWLHYTHIWNCNKTHCFIGLIYADFKRSWYKAKYVSLAHIWMLRVWKHLVPVHKSWLYKPLLNSMFGKVTLVTRYQTPDTSRMLTLKTPASHTEIRKGSSSLWESALLWIINVSPTVCVVKGFFTIMMLQGSRETFKRRDGKSEF